VPASSSSGYTSGQNLKVLYKINIDIDTHNHQKSLLLLLLNRLPPDITGGQGLKKTFFKQYI
jgi:hypothetical protein